MEKQASLAERVSYSDLYKRWERGNWQATALDFSVDRDHWHNRFTETQRRAALWNYSLFLHGEDSVADTLSPFIDAAPREEQKYFLATQQVDEARHAVFFSRFMNEVVVDDAGSMAAMLERTQPELTWGFRKLFDLLDRTAEKLRRDRSLANLAAAVALYHIVVEATVAQTGQHFIDSYLERDGLLPGFHEGMANVAADEQRHIAFGVKLLSDLVAADPRCKDAIAEVLREALRYTVALFIPPNWDRSYVECFGTTLEDLYTEALRSFESKLRAAGLELDELPGAYPLPTDIPQRQRAERAIALVEAGVAGEKNGAPSRDPQVMQMVFDAVRRSVDHRHAPRGTATIQWDFSDAEPWHLQIADGTATVSPGALSDPDLRLRCRWEDWVDVAIGRQSPRSALVRGRLRPRGSLRLLWRLQWIFGV